MTRPKTATMLIPREFLQRLRDAVSVSEVVGKRVPLKRHGREWQACCPFHQEKSPSFTVNDAKGFYHCFGCGAHGDALKFLIEYERLSYPEAVEALARETGMEIPKPTPDQEKRERQRRSLEEILEQACNWFCQQLQLAQGQSAREYLAKRGIPLEIQRYFRLGYAPDARTALKDFLLAQGATESQLLEAGLIIRPDQGNSYDRFRGRVIFPITDSQGQVIAFGGRLLAKESKAAKYLNSPETALFHKGQVLYNWRNARQESSESQPLVVVEGYMDVIALYQYGVPQAVAPLGTALTEEHLNKLWQAVDMPVLCFDGDAAGQKAMWRAAELALPLLQPGKSLKFCLLPGGEDPDDFLRHHGAEAFRKLLTGALPLSQVIVEQLRRQTGDQTPEQRAALEKQLEQWAARITHASLQQHFRRYFRQQLWPGKKQVPQTAAKVKQLAATDSRAQGLRLLEKQVVRLLLCYPELLERHEVEEIVGSLHFQDATATAMQSWILSSGSLSIIEDWPEVALHLKADKTIALPAIAAQNPQLAWLQILDNYHLVQMQEDMDSLQRDLATDLTEENLQRMQSLQQQISELQAKRYA